MDEGTTGPQLELDMRARKTKHITRACVGCRKRKTKCDGAKPRCANCALYQQACTFSPTIDKRKMASKERVSMMVAYIQDLEALVITNGLDLPSSRPDILLPPVAPSAPADIQPRESTKAFPTWPASEDQAQMLGDRSSVPSTEDSPATHCGLSVSTESSSVLNTLSDRIGSLQVAEDGQLRFFGPTSNLHISHVGPFPLFNSNIRSVHRTEELVLKAAGVDHHVDEELEDHLTKLYFAWENPNIPIVDERTYYEEKMRYRKLDQDSHRYSEVLMNAMCAIGAALTSRYRPDLPESLVDFFATRAKALLEVEMDSPTLSTVQSLGILSGVEALLTRDARGWLYSGMAMRLAIDLGLHVDPTPFVERGVMDMNENVEPPPRPANLSDTNKMWSPYVDENRSSTDWECRSCLDEVAQATIDLCSKMSSIRKVLYNAPKDGPLDMQRLHNFATKTRHELDAWQAQLPEGLCVDITQAECVYPPHVLQLHMQLHALRIIVDRPFVLSDAATSALAPDQISESRESCNGAALGITKLVQIFRRHYSLRRVNIQAVHLIFTAMLVHVHNACLSEDYEICHAAQRHLEICSQALGEIGQAYKNALRALEVITSIKSSLLLIQRRAMNPWAELMNQPGFINSMVASGQPQSTVPVLNSEAQLPRSTGDFGTDGLQGVDLLRGLGLEVPNTSLAGQVVLLEQWPWNSLSASLAPSNAEEDLPDVNLG
ncbi:uncharacterized protein N7496_005671 [Penicillium cataractarum]|uniref:Zn(2)-C6 fungal-type domain-containing protein n=1 Tax=Penicillium cataractarum TaxID=2100454 RepID=A0A9W9SGL9_9EURO|nr:uncharacterized protein N7496_005671 [Penicillium cataractarum]KAJ5378262.1 hypothetical protein N7496_005671 [Penicillium cataractarum]